MNRVILFASLTVIVLTGLFLWAGEYFSEDLAGRENGRVPIGGDFALQDVEGKGVTNDDLQGKYRLVYFGYTFCPDICPTSLQAMSQATESLKDVPLVPLFISVDPERDTPEQLKLYSENFPGVVALTGSPEQLKEAAKVYRIYYKKAESEEASDYLIDHTSLIYLMDREGRYRAHFPHTISGKELAEGVRKAINAEDE